MVAPQVSEAPAVSVAEALVAAATQALSDGQLVEPDERNARTLFREALALEPDNAEALRGLRAISNEFVQRAQQSLSADEPLRAYAALAAAAETDPANPAIEIVNQLLVAKANGKLADARLAVATGNFDLAAQQLAQAEQYKNIDPAETQAIRQQIEQGQQDDQLVMGVAVADTYIAEGKLLAPEGDNAYAVILDLRAQHGEDARLLASTERLGERLLTRAAFAAAAGRVAEAGENLDAVMTLGILASEVEAARAALETIDTAAEPDLVQSSPIPAQPIETEPEPEELPAPQVAEQDAGAEADMKDTAVSGIGEAPETVAALPIVEEPQTVAATPVADEPEAVAASPVADEPDTVASTPGDETVVHRHNRIRCAQVSPLCRTARCFGHGRDWFYD